MDLRRVEAPLGYGRDSTQYRLTCIYRDGRNQRVASGTHMSPLTPVSTQMTGSPVFTSHVGCIASLWGHQVCTTGVADAEAVPANAMQAAAMIAPTMAVLSSTFIVFSLVV